MLDGSMDLTILKTCGFGFCELAVVIAVVLEAEVWVWKKVDKRHNGALSSK
jgi:hypothetical protein